MSNKIRWIITKSFMNRILNNPYTARDFTRYSENKWICTNSNCNGAYKPGDIVQVKDFINGADVKYIAKEKETMGEDKPITKYYHAIGEGKLEPLSEIKECEFEVKPDKSMSVEDFCKNILGIDYPGYRASKIANYDYIIANGMAVTKIYWSDNSVTICKAPLDKADQYTGFMIAVAKYAMGNKNEATNAADYWINKRPAQIAKVREKVKADIEEAHKRNAKRRKRREEYRLRLAAIRRKEAYEAARLANEKYGVPLDFKENGED